VSKGTPYQWPKGEIRVYFDPGPLGGGVDNEAAKAMVREAWGKWEGAAITDDGALNVIAGVNFIDAGNISGVDDIDENNYQQFYFDENGANDPNRPTVIIFDHTGLIMKDLVERGEMADGQQDSVLGLTDIYAKDSSTKMIHNATIILNGDYYSKQSNKEVFKAAIVHELGHMMNMDHSDVNQDCYDDENCAGDGDGWAHLPTMYRYAVSSTQASPQHDDVIWSAFMTYNVGTNKKLISDFCTIEGKIYDKLGRGFQGAKVHFYNKDSLESRNHRVQSVSGVLQPPCALQGTYWLPGVPVGTTVKVKYGSLSDWCGYYQSKGEPCTLMSGINPYAPPRPVDSGFVQFQGEYEVTCEEGGTRLYADFVKLEKENLDDDLYKKYDNFIGPDGNYIVMCDPANLIVTPDQIDPDADPTDGSGGSASSSFLGGDNSNERRGYLNCSLNKNVTFSWLAFLVFIPILVLLGRRRKYI